MSQLRTLKSICALNSDNVAQSLADFRFLKTNGRHIEILLPVSTLTFSLSSACVCIPNSMQIGPSVFLRFSRWRPQGRKSASGFGFDDIMSIKNVKIYFAPNFDNGAQSATEVLLFPFSKTNVGHIEILLSASSLTLSSWHTNYHPNRTTERCLWRVLLNVDQRQTRP